MEGSAEPLSRTLATDAQRAPDGAPADPSRSEPLHELGDLALQLLALVVQIAEAGQADRPGCQLAVFPCDR